ncbi:hypothetical protein L598_002000000160 [Mesorhizobium sp. J18]|nr:hypothetical protein L598_002000000160 [Mesorhizobium sp. J18]
MEFRHGGSKGIAVKRFGIGAHERGLRSFRASAALCATLAASGLLLAGCMGAPTYGTGTPADQQLLEDLSGALTFSSEKKEPIDYSPRPGLVMPASTTVLPPPQEDVATVGNPAWPESNEQRLARIRAEATANQDNPSYSSGVDPDIMKAASRSKAPPRRRWNEIAPMNDTARTREEFNERLAERQQGNPNQRKYLSEPPLVYRQPASTAPVGDVGEDEWRKQREAKRNARRNLPGRAQENLPPERDTVPY